MKRQVKIGVDYHGVITANPDFFKVFNQKALDKGCKIYILSGGAGQDIKEYLHLHGIVYSVVWSMLDYFERKNMVLHLSDGSFQVKDSLWNEAKAKYCRENGIDFHIDDSALYGENFETPFCLYDARQEVCLTGKHNQLFLNFHLPPEEVLNQILAFLGEKV